MYKAWIPIQSVHDGLAEELRRSGASNLLIVFPRVLRNDAMLKEELAAFLRKKTYLEDNGFTVGAWLAPSIGYGGTGSPSFCDNDAATVYTRIKFTSGSEVFAYCPLDEAFVEDFCHTISALAASGVDFILLEDDFTLSGGKVLADVGCCCERHRRLLTKRLGKELSLSELRELLLSSAPNTCRDQWLHLQGETLRTFAQTVERAVHRVNPICRIGLSANSSSFLVEGVPLSTLACDIAGKTRPFIRLTGAPYWKYAKTLAANIEAIRLQSHWCDKKIELVSEGDTHPRPRSFEPAASLEMYDMILRADGCTDGILKYMMDYISKPTFETGYMDQHVKNQPHYAEIDRRFGGKASVGLDIIEQPDSFRQMDFSFDASFAEYARFLPTMSQWFAEDNSIPTTYGKHGCAHLAFGANVSCLTEEDFKDGLITDAVGADLLLKRGIDIGIKAQKKAERPTLEYFLDEDDFTSCATDRPGSFCDYTLDEKAIVLSEFCTGLTGGLLTDINAMRQSKKFCACFLYENSKKQRFMVYSFVPHSVYVTSGWNRGVFRNYYRQKQLARGIEFLQGRPLPAMCFHAPDLYILCKKEGGEMAVGLWNIYPDEVLHPVIKLDRTYTSCEFYHGSGTISGNEVLLDQPIAPYSFVFFTVK